MSTIKTIFGNALVTVGETGSADSDVQPDEATAAGAASPVETGPIDSDDEPEEAMATAADLASPGETGAMDVEHPQEEMEEEMD